jgi:hypothetical protein
MLIAKKPFSVFNEKKCAVCFDGAYGTKKKCPDYTSCYCCRVAAWVLRKLGTSNSVN